MKQVVPLICPERPLVKTGFEEIVARLSGRGVWARADGRVVQASAEEIVIFTPDGSQDIYPLQPYSPTSTHTCFVQRPIIKVGDVVTAGQLIADGAAMRGGELALGADVLVAYMPWERHNFEDAIVISERLVRDDVLTSLHVERMSLVHCEEPTLRQRIEEILQQSQNDRQALEQLLALANERSPVQLERGKAQFFDGRTGRPFANPIAVGYQYLMKLNHLVEDKLQAREEGAYATITQQPVRGRRLGGGQRLGEMEVWALEAHGVAGLLRESLTSKADDVVIRAQLLEHLGEEWVPSHLPEAFRVTAYLLLGLGLKLDLFRQGAAASEELLYGAPRLTPSVFCSFSSIGSGADLPYRHDGPEGL